MAMGYLSLGDGIWDVHGLQQTHYGRQNWLLLQVSADAARLGAYMGGRALNGLDRVLLLKFSL
jgi:hypothetical protein